jgi:hypothetical protein
MREAKATKLEVVSAFDDAWLLDDEEWAEAAGGREALGKRVKSVDEEGRIAELDLTKCPCKVVPASVGRLRGLTYLKLMNCKGLVSADLGSTSLTSIGEGAFYGCSSLSAITLPDGLTSIGDRTFDSCSSLSAITLPDGLTSIGQWAFGIAPR